MAPQSDDDELSRSVVIITQEHMDASYKKLREAAKNAGPPDPAVVAVWGYPTDQHPRLNGLGEIKEVVDMIGTAGIPCCLVAEPALIYYGIGRVLHDWHLCVPTEQLEKTGNLFRAQPTRFEPFPRSKATYPARVDHLYPRFKFVGLRLFFTIQSSYACHLEITPENVEFSTNGLPYPTLPVYAQSLLDGGFYVDLEDLIDGMNLTLEWGKQHLNLEGSIDGDFIWWKVNASYGYKGDEVERPAWYSDPDKRLDAWAKRVTAEAKRARQTWKYQPDYETRFCRTGSKDPRL